MFGALRSRLCAAERAQGLRFLQAAHSRARVRRDPGGEAGAGEEVRGKQDSGCTVVGGRRATSLRGAGVGRGWWRSGNRTRLWAGAGLPGPDALGDSAGMLVGSVTNSNPEFES